MANTGDDSSRGTRSTLTSKSVDRCVLRGVVGRAAAATNAVEESHRRLIVGDAARRTGCVGKPTGVSEYVWLSAFASGGG